MHIEYGLFGKRALRLNAGIGPCRIGLDCPVKPGNDIGKDWSPNSPAHRKNDWCYKIWLVHGSGRIGLDCPVKPANDIGKWKLKIKESEILTNIFLMYCLFPEGARILYNCE